jgi:hypothetical protein
MTKNPVAPDDLTHILNIPPEHKDLAGDVLELARQALAWQDVSRARVEGKASAQIAASGVSVTVAGALLTLALARTPASLLLTVLIVVVLLAFLFGICSVAIAVYVLQIRAHKTLDVGSMFGPHLASIRAQAADDESVARAHWRLGVAIHLVEAVRANDRRSRAPTMLWAQLAYLAFLLFTATAVIMIAIGSALGVTG